MIYNICKDTPHFHSSEGPGWLNELGSWITKQLMQAYHHYRVNYKKVCTRLTAASDKAYQLLAHGRWFSPGTPASSTTKTGSHGIAEILLKVALKHQQNNQSIEVSVSIQATKRSCICPQGIDYDFFRFPLWIL
jgi:hypothetical protein